LLIAETGTPWTALLTDTHFGRLFLIRLPLILAVGASIVWDSPRVSLVSSALVLASLAWCGHAAASENVALQIAVDAAHLLAAGIWPGALLPLAFYLAANRSETRRVVRRFSASSLIAVSVLSATGCANSFFRLGTFSALLATTYGRLLSLKNCLFMVTISIAAWNLLWLVPRLESSSLRLKRNVTLEIALAAGIIVVVERSDYSYPDYSGLASRVAPTDTLRAACGSGSHARPKKARGSLPAHSCSILTPSRANGTDSARRCRPLLFLISNPRLPLAAFALTRTSFLEPGSRASQSGRINLDPSRASQWAELQLPW
jgi:uncharacterized membrane protein